jgi:GTP cyclohydrolase I
MATTLVPPAPTAGWRRDTDLDAAARAVSDLLVALGHDPTTEHLAETPQRVARAFAELLAPRPFDLTTFPNDEGYDEAEHLCMSLRGVRAQGSRTMTSAVHGLLRDDARTRQEFFALTGISRARRPSSHDQPNEETP